MQISFREWLLSESFDFHSKLKAFFSKKKRNWRKLLTIDPIPKLLRIHDLLEAGENEYRMSKPDDREIWQIIAQKNYIGSVMAGCMTQMLYPEENTFSRFDFIGMIRQMQMPNSLEEARALAKEIYDPNNKIRIGLSQLYTTDLWRSSMTDW